MVVKRAVKVKPDPLVLRDQSVMLGPVVNVAEKDHLDPTD